jgi:hypothetical protein
MEIPSVRGRTEAPLLEVWILGVGPAAACRFLLELDLLSPQAFADKVRVAAHQGLLPQMPKAFLEDAVDGNNEDGDPLLEQYIIPVITLQNNFTGKPIFRPEIVTNPVRKSG